MGNPAFYFQDTVGSHTIIFKRRAAKPQGVNLIKYTFVSPHNISSFLFIKSSCSISRNGSESSKLKQDSLIIKGNLLDDNGKSYKISKGKRKCIVGLWKIIVFLFGIRYTKKKYTGN